MPGAARGQGPGPCVPSAAVSRALPSLRPQLPARSQRPKPSGTRTPPHSRQNNLCSLNLSDRRRHASPPPSLFPSLPGQSLRDSQPRSGSSLPRLPDGSAGRPRLPAAPRRIPGLFHPSPRDDIPIVLRGESAPRGTALVSRP